MNCGPAANTAIKPCHRHRWKRVSAVMNAPSVPPASMPCWAMSARTAVAVSHHGPSGLRATGRTEIIWGQTRRPRRSGIGRSIRASTRYLRLRYELSYPRGVRQTHPSKTLLGALVVMLPVYSRVQACSHLGQPDRYAGQSYVLPFESFPGGAQRSDGSKEFAGWPG